MLKRVGGGVNVVRRPIWNGGGDPGAVRSRIPISMARQEVDRMAFLILCGSASGELGMARIWQ
jgi:hypothetical protein